MKFTIIDRSAAGCHNGGICTRFLDAFTVDHCVFSPCSHNTKESETGAVFLVYENPFESSIVDSNFVHNEPNGSFVITVVSGHGLVFARCCLTGVENRLFHDRNYVLENCSLEAAVCESVITAMEYGQGGKGRGKPKRALREGAVKASPWRRNLLVLIGSGIVSLVRAGALTIGQMLVRRLFKWKLPKAIQ